MRLATSDLDLSLAVKRVKRDIRDDWFVDPLRYGDILSKRQFDRWLKDADGFGKTDEFNIPKEGFVVRAASEMFIHERVLYQAVVDMLIEEYDSLLRPCVFSHRLRLGREDFIFLNAIDAWRDFNENTRLAMDSDNKVVVITDIQNYYQCIRFETLCNLLEDEEPNADGKFAAAISLLRRLLHAWRPDGVGLPQNRDASSFLGNIFLRDVDEHMVLNGYNYLRYMDDIRIVCEDVYEARRALQDLIILLREYDLGVNGKKTQLLSRTDDEYVAHIPEADLRLEEIDELLRQRKVRSLRKAIPKLEAYADELSSAGQTNSKAFRFCINRIERLARCRDISYDASRYVDVAIELLIDEPWSTEMLIRLLRSADLTADQTARVVDLVMCERRNIYEWQSYLLWQLAAVLDPDEAKDRLKRSAREAVGSDRPIPYQAGAVLYLGTCGNAHDRRHVLRKCADTRSNMLLRAVAIATQKPTARDTERRDTILPSHYRESTASLDRRGSAHSYFAPLPMLTAAKLYDDLPCFYFWASPIWILISWSTYLIRLRQRRVFATFSLRKMEPFRNGQPRS